MSFNDDWAQASPDLLAGFAETVQVINRANGSAWRQVQAIVKRQGVEALQGGHGAGTKSLVLQFRNDASTAAESIFKVKVAWEYRGTPEEFTLPRPTSQDSGFVRYTINGGGR
jgi:hypothetical protein